MEVRRILLTSDDGYRAAGLRAIANQLRGRYELAIASTLSQQSGTGGAMRLMGGRCGVDSVDGIPAIWVDTFPSDAVEAAAMHFGRKFDLVISGINSGPNVGCCFSSGTVAAAVRAINSAVCKHAISLSWDNSWDRWFAEHHEDNPESFYPYPAEAAAKFVESAIKNNFWGSPILNVNFPSAAASEAIFTRPQLSEGYYFFGNTLTADLAKGTFRYTIENGRGDLTTESDGRLLRDGFITITPIDPYFDHRERLNLQGKRLSVA